MFIILSLAGSIISGLSIFAMFGKVAAHDEFGELFEFTNMFQAAFGQNMSSTKVTGLLVLFIFALIVVVLSVFNVIFLIKKDMKKVLIISSSTAVLALVDAIISFCTLKFLDAPSEIGFKLGAGPILYSVLNLLALVSFAAAIILYFAKSNPFATFSVNKTKSDSNAADTLAKYKKLLDEGAITEEEYNKKKKKLLEK